MSAATGSQRARAPSRGARLIMLGLLLAVSGCASRRHEPAGKAVTLEGEVVDPQCWFTHGARGLEHRSCAVFCARGGQDLAFMNRGDQAVYQVIASRHGQNPNDSLIAYVGYAVVVQGAFFGAGQERVLRVDGIRRVDGLPPDPLPADTSGSDPMPHLAVPTPTPQGAR